MNPADKLEEIARHSPYLTAIVGDKDLLNYSELNKLVWSCVGLLSNEDLHSGMTIGIAVRSELFSLALTFATFRMGLSQLTLTLTMSSQDRAAILRTTKPQAIISDIPSLQVGNSKVISITPKKVSEQPIPKNYVRSVSDTQSFFFLLGSGTTGDPKVICYSVEELCRSMKRDLIARPIAQHERHYSLSSVSFFTAKRRSLSVLSVGGAVVLLTQKGSLFAICNFYAVDHVSAAVVHFSSILANIDQRQEHAKLPRLKSLWIGGSPVSDQLRKKLRKHISSNTYVTYGTNEVGEICVASPEIQDLHPDCIGTVLPGVELEIVNEDGDKLDSGEIGFIRIRGGGMFEAYSANANKQEINQEDGAWFTPKDLGLISEDGTVIFKGRADDLIIYNGINIYPREIEEVLEAHPAVAEVAAMPIESDAHGQIPVAIVSLKSRTSKGKLMRFCVDRLLSKAPQKIILADKLPRNEAGKILKRELAAHLLEKLDI